MSEQNMKAAMDNFERELEANPMRYPAITGVPRPDHPKAASAHLPLPITLGLTELLAAGIHAGMSGSVEDAEKAMRHVEGLAGLIAQILNRGRTLPNGDDGEAMDVYRGRCLWAVQVEARNAYWCGWRDRMDYERTK